MAQAPQPEQSYELDDLLDELADGAESLDDLSSVKFCYKPCEQGGGPTGFPDTEVCPAGFTDQAPDCTQYEAMEDALLAAVEEQKRLAEELQAQLEEARALQEESQDIIDYTNIDPLPVVSLPTPVEPTKAGLGGLPKWALPAGIAVVALALFLRKKPA
jgi:hypothetical protein